MWELIPPVFQSRGDGMGPSPEGGILISDQNVENRREAWCWPTEGWMCRGRGPSLLIAPVSSWKWRSQILSWGCGRGGYVGSPRREQRELSSGRVGEWPEHISTVSLPARFRVPLGFAVVHLECYFWGKHASHRIRMHRADGKLGLNVQGFAGRV